MRVSSLLGKEKDRTETNCYFLGSGSRGSLTPYNIQGVLVLLFLDTTRQAERLYIENLEVLSRTHLSAKDKTNLSSLFHSKSKRLWPRTKEKKSQRSLTQRQTLHSGRMSSSLKMKKTQSVSFSQDSPRQTVLIPLRRRLWTRKQRQDLCPSRRLCRSCPAE